MAKLKPNIIILGPQGSGKSTQANILEQEFGYTIIHTGKLIRKYIADNKKYSAKISTLVNSGKLIPANILFDEILTQKIKNIDQKKPIVFDGVPRNREQLDDFLFFLEKNNITLPYLINIYISDKMVIKRITDRKICPRCEKAYRPQDSYYLKNTCPDCKINLIRRSDDLAEKTLQQRLDIFHKNNKKLALFFIGKKHYFKINGDQSIKQVSQEIKQIIKNHD